MSPSAGETSRAGYLDVVTLEEVQVGLALARLFAHQSQDGVVAAGVHHRLTVLDDPDGEILQLVLKRQDQTRWGQIHKGLIQMKSRGLHSDATPQVSTPKNQLRAEFLRLRRRSGALTSLEGSESYKHKKSK